MTTLILCCRRCLTEYQIDKTDTIKGYAWWSLCPDCRPSANDTLMDGRKPHEHDQEGDTAA